MGGALVLAALTQVAWFHQAMVERGSGAPTGLAHDLTPWDAAGSVTRVVMVTAAVVGVLALMRVAPWLVAAGGLALVATLAVLAVGTLGSGSLPCCPEVRTDTTPLLPFALAGVAALTITVAGFWAGESD